MSARKTLTVTGRPNGLINQAPSSGVWPAGPTFLAGRPTYNRQPRFDSRPCRFQF